MKNQRLCSKLATVASLWCGFAFASDTRFGELPDGSLGTAETYGVSAEICREHVFNPAATALSLPEGYRLHTVSDLARRNNSIKSLLEAHPKIHGYALGVLCFLRADKFVVEDTPDQTVQPVLAAFWWASAEGPLHSSMRGKAQWVQLGSWYASNTPNRPAILKADPMAAFADLEVVEHASNRWRMRLVLPDEVLVAEALSSHARTPSAATQPAHMSVPMSGRSKDRFTVYTYFGHVHRSAQGTWRATGSGVFSEALAVAGEDEAFETVFQEGWSSRSGLYSFSGK